MKRKIIIYTVEDSIFTLEIVEWIITHLEKNYSIDVFFAKKTKLRILKSIFTFMFFGSIYHLIKLFFLKNSLKKIKKNHNIEVIEKVNKKYKFGISINYSKKIKLKKYNVYNFHLGNFKNQRGSFIFFYKFLYNWKSIDLTFHKIDNFFDNGLILKKKTINVKKLKASEILYLYNKNKRFILDSLDKIKKSHKKKDSSKRNKRGLYNSEPSFLLIIKTFYLNLFSSKS